MKNNRADGMIDNKEISKQLTVAMIENQITVAELAHRIDEKNSFVRKLRDGEECTAYTVKRIAWAFGMGLHRFLELK